MRKNSIGNDIISLLNTNAGRAGNPQFYSRFITKTEQDLFANLSSRLPLYKFAWLCWSIKEAVYKFQQRLQPELSFVAGKITIQHITLPAEPFNLGAGVIEHNEIAAAACYSSTSIINGETRNSYSIITNDFIYTITAQNTDKIFWGIKKISGTTYKLQHEQVRFFVSSKLKKVLQTEDVVIEKTTDGVPFLKKLQDVAVSFSHHENFVAYAFCLPSLHSIKNEHLILDDCLFNASKQVDSII